MILKNYKDIYRRVAEKYNLDYSLVEAIGEFTWNDLNHRISEFMNREIYVYKFGSFKFRKQKGEWLKDKLERAIPLVSSLPDIERREKSIKSLNIKIEKIKGLLKEWEAVIEAKRAFKKDIYGEEYVDGNFRKQIQDLGRSQKQDIQERSRRTSIPTEDSDM